MCEIRPFERRRPSRCRKNDCVFFGWYGKVPGRLGQIVCVGFWKDGHHRRLGTGVSVYTFIDLHHAAMMNSTGNFNHVPAIRSLLIWFHVALNFTVNKWTSSAIVDASCVPLYIRKQLDRSLNNDTCPGSWISFGRKDRENWSGCQTHL